MNRALQEELLLGLIDNRIPVRALSNYLGIAPDEMVRILEGEISFPLPLAERTIRYFKMFNYELPTLLAMHVKRKKKLQLGYLLSQKERIITLLLSNVFPDDDLDEIESFLKKKLTARGRKIKDYKSVARGNFLKELKKERKETYVSVNEMAEILNLEPSQYSSIEGGSRKITEEQTRRVIRYLKMKGADTKFLSLLSAMEEDELFVDETFVEELRDGLRYNGHNEYSLAMLDMFLRNYLGKE